jgi:hypothetical protein
LEYGGTPKVRADGRKGFAIVATNGTIADGTLGPRRAAVRPGPREDVRSSAGYSIYEGRRFKGQAVRTLVRGRLVVLDGALIDSAVGTGRYVSREL